MLKKYILVDLFSGSYNEEYVGHEVLNLERNSITGKFYGYLPPHDNPNILKLGGSSLDEYVDDILVIFLKKISSKSTKRRLIGFYPSARVYKERQDGEDLFRFFKDIDGSIRTASYSMESKDFYEVDRSSSLIINPKEYNNYMFRRQRVYSGTYPDLDKVIYDYINYFLSRESIEDDIIMQEEIQESLAASEKVILKAPDKEISFNIHKHGKRLSRNPGLVKSAIIKSDYKCENNPKHKTFINQNNEYYMEGHHLIPYTIKNASEIWDRFGKNIDCLENIVSLCPTCHRAIHFGSKEEKKKILSNLIRKHLPYLRNIGIDIDEDYIYKLYGL